MGIKALVKSLGLASVMTITILSFQNCAKTSFSPTDDFALSKVDAPQDVQVEVPGQQEGEISTSIPKETPEVVEPVDDSNNENNPQDPYSGVCEVYRDIQFPSNEVFSAPDFTISPERRDPLLTSIVPSLGRVSTLEIANNVKISSFAGALLIKEANTVEVGAIATRLLKVNANEVKSIRLAGHVCLHARKVGQVTGAAHVKIIADSVEKISFAGHAHIYGATVDLVEGAGSVCLYEGAKVLKSSGAIKVKNCSIN